MAKKNRKSSRSWLKLVAISLGIYLIIRPNKVSQYIPPTVPPLPTGDEPQVQRRWKPDLPTYL